MPIKDSAHLEPLLLRTLGEHTLDLIYAKDREGRFLFVNAALARAFGVQSSREVLGKWDFDYHPEEMARGYYEDDQNVIRSGQPLIDREERLNDAATGRPRWYSTTKVPLEDENGKVIGVIGISRDITTTKEAEFEARRLNAELEQRVNERTEELKKLAETLEKERHLMRTLIDSMPDNIYAKDDQSRFLLANRAVTDSMGTSQAEILGTSDFNYFPEDLAQQYFDDEQQLLRSGKPLLDREEPSVNTETGKTRWLLTSKVPVRNDAGQIVGLVGIGRDISKRREVERALRRSEERFRSLTELSSDWYWEQDEQLRFIDFTDANARSGFQKSDVLDKTVQELPGTEPLGHAWLEHQSLTARREPFRDLELRRLASNGETVYLSLSGLPMYDDLGHFQGYRGIGQDITERKRSEEHVHYLATHDSLTGLPNRFMFSEILNIAIESARRYQRKLAVLFVDLDRFKTINDTLGHDAGDTLLKALAHRFTDCLRSSDTVARLGGDEFVILLQEVETPDKVSNVAQKLISAAVRPVTILGQECRVTASIGICMYPTDADDEQTLMKNADIAMYRAKAEGKNTYQFYSPDIQERSLERLMLENNLRLALERNQFFLHYQAKRNLKSGEIAGVEALVRWQHPDLGIVSPAQFIPLAEETGLIVIIGRWVLKTACEQNMAWQEEGLPPICMAVNLSARQFFDEHLVEDIATALNESGMKPELLELEITEGMVMQDAERAIRILTAIKALGVRLAIDDFGVGYSSLAQIKRFPIDTLKVDRSFIRDIPADREDQAITQAIIAMGRTLSLTVVAEGVETVEQETFLRDHSCDQSQGFYFSRPVGPGEFATLMRDKKPYPER
ncbi:sensor domain-containing protein [Marinimicrobium sp. C2-29]|uniref:sensor domain-containing protein n=1 Tax=Marinimicrobium sp. C2-29 TaxID=3139825 RepID=UPI003139D831